VNVRVLRAEELAPPRARGPRPEAPLASSDRPRGNRRIEPKGSALEADRPAPARRPTLRKRFAALGGRAKAWGARVVARARGPAQGAVRGARAPPRGGARVAIVRAVDRYARTSPEFAIDTLTITGNARVPNDELEEAMGLAIGDNVFARSPEEAGAALEAHPWVASATVRRRLPRTVEVEVRERVPALMLVLEEPFLVDQEANVFKPFEEGDPVDLPVITGADPERFGRERGYRTELLTASIALVHEWQAASLSRREPIAEIHVEPDEGLTLFVGDEGTEIRLGRGPYRSKLARLRRVLDELTRRQSRALYVYLDNVRRPDRVTVRVR
jgi:cell division protein FtsQ